MPSTKPPLTVATVLFGPSRHPIVEKRAMVRGWLKSFMPSCIIKAEDRRWPTEAPRAILAVLLAGSIALCALAAWRLSSTGKGVALASSGETSSRFDAKLSRSLQTLDHRLSQSAWRLSTPQLSYVAARGAAVARIQGGR